MASPTPTRISFRILILVALMVLLFYVGRPLYWKISATIHDIRHNKQSVREGNPRPPPLSIGLTLSYLFLLRSVLFGYRYISDRTRGAEIGGMVSRRVGLWDLRGSLQEIESLRLSEASFRRWSVRKFHIWFLLNNLYYCCVCCLCVCLIVSPLYKNNIIKFYRSTLS